MASSLSLRRLVGLGFLCLTAAVHGETWESTIGSFTPGPFPELRPVRAQYSFGWSGISAAGADIRFSKTNDGRFRLEANGGTTGLARALWRYDLIHTGLADTQTLRPIVVKEIEKTRSKETNTTVTFSPEGVGSQVEERKGGDVQIKDRRFDFPNALSVETALLFLRSQSLPNGAVHRVVVYPATSAYLCTVTVNQRERVTVPAGSYNAIKLDLQLSKIGAKRELLPHKKFRNATVWLSDDSDRLLLRVEGQVFIGTVFAELRSIQFEKPAP